MLSRAGRIALTILLTIWLNAVLPAHTRGRITIPTGNDAANDHCAQPVASHCCPKTGKPLPGNSPTDPTPDQKSRCAVCYFAKGLSDHSGPALTLQPLGLLHTLPLPAPQQPHSLQPIPTYQGRAPPAA